MGFSGFSWSPSSAWGQPVLPRDWRSWLRWLAALPSRSLRTWAGLVDLGSVTMALAYVLLFAGRRTTASGSVAVATLLEPVTAVVIAVLVLGETLTPAGMLGSLLILAAIGSLGLRQEIPEVH